MSAPIKYLDENGLRTLVQKIKANMSVAYKVRGDAIYADQSYLDKLAENEATPGTHTETWLHAEIDGIGVWQNIGGTWTHILEFDIGWVYNIINPFTKDSDFKDYIVSANNEVIAGTNIVVVEMNNNGGQEEYKFDTLSGVTDLGAYQLKTLLNPITVFPAGAVKEDPTWTSSATLPYQGQANQDHFVENELAKDTQGNIYQCHVTVDQSDSNILHYTFVRLGNPSTIEGALELLGNLCPNTTITDAEIEAMF